MEPQIMDIRECWEKVKPGLEIIKRRCAADWRVEDVYAKCVAGTWTLFMADGVDGFLICCQGACPYRNMKILHIECAYYAGDVDPFEVFMPVIETLARQIGALEIEFRSPRTGFERKGWKVVDRVYRMEVSHG